MIAVNSSFALLIIMMFSMATAWASNTIPYIFTKGSPARSYEVNENFSVINARAQHALSLVNYLDTRVTQLEKAKDNDEILKSKGQDDFIPENYKWIGSYAKKDTSIGEIITILDAQYRIVALPMLDFNTGVKYRIIFPALLYKNGSIDNLRVEGEAGKLALGPNKSVVNGRVASIKVNGVQLYFDSVDQYESRIFVNSWIIAKIALSDNFYVTFSASMALGYKVTKHPTGDYDFTKGDYQWPSFSKKEIVEKMNIYVNYIRIEVI